MSEMGYTMIALGISVFPFLAVVRILFLAIVNGAAFIIRFRK